MASDLRTLSLDSPEWELYKTVVPFNIEGTDIPGLVQHCYQRTVDGQCISAGIFTFNAVKTHIAWGIRSEPHCSFHALALPDGSWGTFKEGCPSYEIILEGSTILGFCVDGKRHVA